MGNLIGQSRVPAKSYLEQKMKDMFLKEQRENKAGKAARQLRIKTVPASIEGRSPWREEARERQGDWHLLQEAFSSSLI